MPVSVVDSPLFQIYLHELWARSDFVARTCASIFEQCPVPPKDGYIKVDATVHSQISTVLTESANIKKLLTIPVKVGFKETKIAFDFRVQRAKLLNAVLANPTIPEISAVEARNSVEHFDQYLDRANLALEEGKVKAPGMALYNMILSSWKIFDKKAFPLKVYVADERRYFNLEWLADINAIYEEANDLLNRVQAIDGFPFKDGPGGLMVPIE